MNVKNANKIKQMSLKDCLNSLSDDQLNQIYDEMVNLFDDNLSMDSSKKDLIESYLMSLYSVFIFKKEKQFEEMKKLLLNIINGEEEINDGLLDRSFLFKINNEYVVPSELVDILNKTEQIPDKVFIEQFINFYILINGVLNVDKLKYLLAESGYKTTKKMILEIVKKNHFIEDNNIIYFDDNAKELFENSNLSEIKDNFDYKVVSMLDLLKFFTFFDEIKNNNELFDSLYKIIKNKKKTMKLYDFIMSYIVLLAGNTSFIEDVLEDFGINLKENDLDKLYDVIDDYVHFIPGWFLNGFTPHEVYCEDDEFDEEDFMDNPDEMKKMYAFGYTTINGVIKIDDLVDIISNKHNLKTNNKELKKLIKDDQSELGLSIIDDYVCFDDFPKDFINLIMNIKVRKDYKIIDDFDEIIDELDDNLEKLFKTLIKYNIDEDIAQQINHFILMGVFNEDLLHEILSNNNINLLEKQIRSLYKELKPIINNMRCWSLNGYKPTEITVQSEGKKVGRNEPCPCGSGKKYKHCCGK